MIQKVFKSGGIPICFSANSDFIPYTAVMIQSIIDHAAPDRSYDINILYSEMNKDYEKSVCSLSKGLDNVSIRFFDVSEYVKDFDFFTGSVYTKSPYSREVYYRLLIPTLMPEYERVIYLDGDMLARTDVAALYDVDISDSLIAACRDYAGIAHCYTEEDERLHYRKHVLGIADIDSYIISGILIFNVKPFSEKFSAGTLMNFSASKDWRQHDQDVLNVLCQGKIHILDGAWNYLFGNTLIKNLPDSLYSEYLASKENPKIVHFAGERKPKWNKVSEHSDLFWQTAKKTPFYELLKSK